MGEVVTESVKETHKQAKNLLTSLSQRKNQAIVIGLTGQLGAGKTEFVRGLLRAAGITDSVTSPTYTIETVYQLPESQFKHAYHIDVYRLENEQDLRNIGFENRLKDAESIILVEWASKVENILPEHTIWVEINLTDNKRVITINNEQRE